MITIKKVETKKDWKKFIDKILFFKKMSFEKDHFPSGEFYRYFFL